MFNISIQQKCKLKPQWDIITDLSVELKWKMPSTNRLAEKLDYSYVACDIVKWHDHSEKFGSSFPNWKWAYNMIQPLYSWSFIPEKLTFSQKNLDIFIEDSCIWAQTVNYPDNFQHTGISMSLHTTQQEKNQWMTMCNNLNELQKNNAEWRKSISEVFKLQDSICVTIMKLHNYGNRDRTSGF